jgi:hypothetical protein
VLVGVLAGCGDETPVGAPRCEGAAVVLVAQSVPGADLVPCWKELPGGWTVSEVDIGSSGTTVALDSDRAGRDAAAFSYHRSCDVVRLGRLPSSREDVDVREDIRSLAGGLDSDRFFVFEGGCVKVTFTFEEFDDLSHAEALVDALVLVERAGLNEELATTSEKFVLR